MFGSNGYFDDAELKRKIETMRGRELKEVAYPEHDEYTEVSDKERLCKHPVVSVGMLAYNQEKFIRQAIEGVMMQETTFEFELIIAEDCSTDDTREICLEYQRRYPDKIRVLYGAENTYRKYGSVKVNGRRIQSTVRAELIALCEGDDYWISKTKLARQYEVFCRNPEVSLCYTRTKYRYEETGNEVVPVIGVTPGLIKGADFWRALVWRKGTKINTCSCMYRFRPLLEFCARLQFPAWDWLLGDVPMMICNSYLGDVYLLDSVDCVYRINRHSISQTTGGGVEVDNHCISAYLSYLLFHLPFSKFPHLALSFRNRMIRIARGQDSDNRFASLFSTSVYCPLLKNPLVLLYYPLVKLFPHNDSVYAFVHDGAWSGVRRLVRKVGAKPVKRRRA